MCGPGPSAPVAKLAVEPEMVGAGAGEPSTVAEVIEASGSVAVTSIEDAEVKVEPSCGAELTTRGAVLSIRIPAATAFEALPNASVTVARTSTKPSATTPVSKTAVNGAFVSVSIAVHAPLPTRYSKRTLAAPAPVIVVRSRYEPEMTGSSALNATPGGVESTVTSTAVEMDWFPSASVASSRRS